MRELEVDDDVQSSHGFSDPLCDGHPPGRVGCEIVGLAEWTEEVVDFVHAASTGFDEVVVVVKVSEELCPVGNPQSPQPPEPLFPLFDEECGRPPGGRVGCPGRPLENELVSVVDASTGSWVVDEDNSVVFDD
ncbi:hypothetical protein FOPE_01904 [Fonsecaea pedrosoi]|nr:hypothetical protein FOPE_01904 [Fonsecaea pedrosoi]